MATPEINENCHYVKMTPIGVRLNLKNFILISFADLELLRKVSQGGGGRNPIPPPGEIGLNKLYKIFTLLIYYKVLHLVYSNSNDLIGSSDCHFLAFPWLFNLITLWSRDGAQVKLQALPWFDHRWSCSVQRPFLDMRHFYHLT